MTAASTAAGESDTAVLTQLFELLIGSRAGAPAGGGGAQQDASAVCRVRGPTGESGVDEAVGHRGDCSRAQLQPRGEVLGGELTGLGQVAKGDGLSDPDTG